MVKFDGSDKQDRDAWADIFDAARNTKDRRLSITLGQREKRQAFESDVYAVFVLYVGLTVVLGIVFVRSVYRDFSMPEFDPAILALMGVYSGTYVGFKFPEKPKVG